MAAVSVGQVRAATLHGTIDCAVPCNAPLTVAAYGAGGLDAGSLLAHLTGAGGPFALTVPDGLGEVHVYGFIDPELKGVPSAGTPVIGAAQNPLHVGTSDVTGLDLVIGPTPSLITMAGAVYCVDCAAVGVRIVSEDAGGALLAQLGPMAPASFALEVPAGVGAVALFAFRDDDFDGEPDGDPVPAAGNSYVIAAQSIVDIQITIPPLPAVELTSVSGVVTCADCAAGVVVAAQAQGPASVEAAVALVEVGPSAAGPFMLVVPTSLGAVDVLAWRAGGGPDPSETVAAAANPISLEGAPISGVEIAIPPLGPGPLLLTGTVTCAACPGPVLVWATAGDATLDEVLVAANGPFILRVPSSTPSVDLVAAPDGDGDGSPDEGFAPVGYSGNPLTLVGDDVSGLTLALGGVGPPSDVQLSGEVTCADCGAIAVGVTGPEGQPLGSLALPAAGPFTFLIPLDAGEAYVSAWRDADLDGAPDPGTEAVSWPANPVELTAGDVEGIVVAIPPLAATDVVVSGEIECADCLGGVGVRIHGAPGVDGPLLAEGLFAPGPWSLSLPHHIGEVWVYGFRDDDGDMEPDSGSEPAQHGSQPLMVTDADLAGVHLTLPPLSGTLVVLSGTITCPGCPGAVVLAGFSPPGLDGVPLLLPTWRNPGPFVLAVPAGLGDLHLRAWPDADLDSVPDQEPVGPLADPVEVGADDIEGLDIAIVVPEPPILAISGNVTCDDCPGAVGVALRDAEGATIQQIGPLSPGPWTLTVSPGLGPVDVFAWRDDDANGAPDGEDAVVPYPLNPVMVAAVAIAGIDIDVSLPVPVEPADNPEQPDIAEPDIAEPDIAEPDIAEPDIAEPDIAEPDASDPGDDVTTPPDVIAPDAVTPTTDLDASRPADTTSGDETAGAPPAGGDGGCQAATTTQPPAPFALIPIALLALVGLIKARRSPASHAPNLEPWRTP